MKSLDKNWEKIFQTTEWGKYPPEELVRFIARNYYRTPIRKKIKILDLGCGTGAATWFIAREGFSAFGIDGSETAIAKSKERFKQENLVAKFRVGDIIKLDFKDNLFDAVLDISAIQHNTPINQKKIVDEIYRILKVHGKVFSIMLNKKSKLIQNNDHRFNEVYIYMFDEDEVRKLFSRFKNVNIERSERTDRGLLMAHFIISAEK